MKEERKYFRTIVQLEIFTFDKPWHWKDGLENIDSLVSDRKGFNQGDLEYDEIDEEEMRENLDGFGHDPKDFGLVE